MAQPELVLGFVAPAGSDFDRVIPTLTDLLNDRGYRPSVIRISDILGARARRGGRMDEGVAAVRDRRTGVLQEEGNQMRARSTRSNPSRHEWAGGRLAQWSCLSGLSHVVDTADGPGSRLCEAPARLRSPHLPIRALLTLGILRAGRSRRPTLLLWTVCDLEYAGEPLPFLDSDGCVVTPAEAREFGVCNASRKRRPQSALAKLGS